MTAPAAIRVTRATRVRWNDETLFRNLDGEAVLLGLGKASYYGLDPVGTRIWELIGERETVDGVLQGVLAEFEVPEEQALGDLVHLLEDLAREGLVDILPSP